MAKNINTAPLSDRIIDFGFEICPDINPVLPEIDVLITDYSSIYLDYLLLNRPCIFIPHDIEQYKEGRGLLLDDYDFWAPGYKVKSFMEFLESLKCSLSGLDPYKTHREEICRQFNYYQTDNSCEKLLNLLEMHYKREN
jgi:CDP-glycerol glycerophosphotransferase (TagB/SpsB family)